MKSIRDIKEDIIAAGYQAVEQLVKVAREEIIKPENDDELAADRLKNAAATKKLAIFDAFEILSRIELEKENLNQTENGQPKIETKRGFAERRSR
jgi:hypothetical protein